MKMTKYLPKFIKKPLRTVRDYLVYLPYRGNGRYCPICKKSSKKFGRFGIPPRDDALCMYCKSLERHRLVWRCFETSTDLFDGRSKTMLHVAPEQGIARILEKRIGPGYITADIGSPEVMVKLDITQIPCGDETFDVIYCSNVLEHVPDDKRAIREFYRVLKPDGWAIILVPVTADVTFEDLSITEPEERLKYFGQEDHVRRYGPDFITRLEEPGFIVRVISPHDILGQEEITLMGITDPAGDIYFCTKQ